VTRESRKWFDDLAVLSSAMINAVLDKTYHQHQASARRYAGEALQHRIVDGADHIQAAAARDQSDGKRLQEVAAEGAADGADEGVTQKSEAMFARGRRREMRAENARENLNNKIG
jgi:phage gp46-like protein